MRAQSSSKTCPVCWDAIEISIAETAVVSDEGALAVEDERDLRSRIGKVAERNVNVIQLLQMAAKARRETCSEKATDGTIETRTGASTKFHHKSARRANAGRVLSRIPSS